MDGGRTDGLIHAAGRAGTGADASPRCRRCHWHEAPLRGSRFGQAGNAGGADKSASASTQRGPSMNELKAGIGHGQRRWFGLILPLPMVPTATQAAGEHYDVAVGFALALCVYLAFMFYVIPALIAWDRRHPAAGMIWAFTLLLGWTGVGWLLALIWAFKAPGAARR